MYKTIWLKLRDGTIEQAAVNKHGEGFFTRRPDGSWQQHLGTGQFYARSPYHMSKQARLLFGGYEGAKMVRGSADNWE